MGGGGALSVRHLAIVFGHVARNETTPLTVAVADQ